MLCPLTQQFHSKKGTKKIFIRKQACVVALFVMGKKKERTSMSVTELRRTCCGRTKTCGQVGGQLQLQRRYLPCSCCDFCVFASICSLSNSGYLWKDLQGPAQEEQEGSWGLGGGGPAPKGHAVQHAPDSATCLASGTDRRNLDLSVGPAHCSGANTKPPPPLAPAGCPTLVMEYFRS